MTRPRLMQLAKRATQDLQQMDRLDSSKCKYVAHLCDCPVRICSYPISASFTKERLHDTASPDQSQRSHSMHIAIAQRAITGWHQANNSCRLQLYGCSVVGRGLGNNSHVWYYSLGFL